MMQLVCEPLRILGKRFCALWQRSRGGCVVMRSGTGLWLQMCACIDERDSVFALLWSFPDVCFISLSADPATSFVFFMRSQHSQQV